MRKAVYRAWRFVHPDVATGQEPPGLGYAPQGGVAMAEDEQAIRQAILLLLSTVPGERVMRPEYGCHVHRLIFAPNDDTTAGLAIHYVRRALQQWEPRIDIVTLDAGRDPLRTELLTIHLTYRVRATLWTDSIRFSLDLTGDEA